MDTRTLTNIALSRCERDGIAVFDPLYVDNCIMTSLVISKNFLLGQGEDRRAWVYSGVHVAAIRSPSQPLTVKYDFTGPTWKMLFTGKIDRNGKLSARRSRITWVADCGEQRGDRGQTARIELHQWLAVGLAADDDLSA